MHVCVRVGKIDTHTNKNTYISAHTRTHTRTHTNKQTNKQASRPSSVSVRTVCRSDSASGGVGKGNEDIFSMFMLFIVSTVESMGVLRISGVENSLN